MGLTQQIGASSLIKPGVIDNTAARPASPYEGQVIFQKDTDQLLVWNGTAWVIPNSPVQNPQGLELVKTQTFTNVSDVNIENVFSSTYKDYRVLITAFSTGSVVRSVRFRYRVGTTNATGSDYYTRGWYNFGTLTGYAPAAQNHWYLGDCFNNAQYPGYISVDIMSPNEASRTVGIGQALESYSVYAYNFNNIHATANVYTGFNLSLDADNISGSVVVYGYRK